MTRFKLELAWRPTEVDKRSEIKAEGSPATDDANAATDPTATPPTPADPNAATAPPAAPQ